MTKFVNPILIAIVSFFPMLALLHTIERDDTPARASGASLLPLPQDDEGETSANATQDGAPPSQQSAWVPFPRFAPALACPCPSET